MAKEGIDSFLLDCHTNENLSEIEATFGIKGFAVIVRLWQKIYSERGYYCEWSDRSPVLFLANWFGGNSGVEINFINEVVAAALRIGIFDSELYEKYSILTSDGIQRRYFEVIKRRTEITVINEYLLVSVGNFKGSVNKKSISADRNAENACRSPTSKEKESKAILSVSNDTDYRTALRRAVDAWNSLEPYGIKQVSRLKAGTERYDRLKARIKEYGIEEVLAAIENIKSSSFLRGKGGNGWHITFDWFVRPNNFPKVHDGNYTDSTYDQPSKRPQNRFNNFPQRQYDFAAMEKALISGQAGDTGGE